MECIITVMIWGMAISGVWVMHRIQPEDQVYKVWAMLDAITITLLMLYMLTQK